MTLRRRHQIHNKYLKINESDHLKAAHQLLGHIIANMSKPEELGVSFDVVKDMLSTEIIRRDAARENATDG